MRTALTVLTDELRRLKASGVATIAVSDESLAALRRAVGVRPATGKSAVPVSRAPEPAPPPAEPPAEEFPPPPAFALPAGGSKTERWEALRAQVMADAVCCRHVRPGRKVVLGVGSLEAEIMFVGEAPGAEEEIQGEPFVGPAGQLLTRMIQAMGLRRDEVYIGNIMNWRPQLPVDADGVQYGNRPPTAAEMAYCLPYLKAQIEIVQPRFLVALGATAAQGLLGAGTFKALGEVRGRWRDYGGRPLMITYHPSYILRNPTNRSKRMIWEDLLQVVEKAGRPITDRQRAYFLEK
jgi:uracil-DNA glycosylase family 4